jgi:hypothetical protein
MPCTDLVRLLTRSQSRIQARLESSQARLGGPQLIGPLQQSELGIVRE